MSFREYVQEAIEQHGHMVLGVGGDLETESPPFAYTIGLTARYGCELLICGMPMHHAQTILNQIAAKWSPDLLDTPTSKFTNLPLLLKNCNTNLGRLHEYVVQADNFYGKKVTVVQVILSDREGRTPFDDTYDHEYMSKFQPLFVEFFE